MQYDNLTTPSTSQALKENSVAETFMAGAGVAPRVQQLDCVQRVCSALRADCHSETPSNYLIQHATGSGKSLTIAALAHQLTHLVDERGNRFRHVIIVADRKALEEQLGGVVRKYLDAHDDTEIERAESCMHLRQLLAQAPGSADRQQQQPCRVIVTTFQKALTRGGVEAPAKSAATGDDDGCGGYGSDDGGVAPASSAGEGEGAEISDHEDAPGTSNGRAAKGATASSSSSSSSSSACLVPRVAILADEAHRSHGHGTTAALHALLCGGSGQPRHIAYVSFTATPSEVALRLFGVANHDTGRREPFHCFSLRQALASGLCVDVLSRYTTARPSATVTDSNGRPQSLEHVLNAPAKRGASQRSVERAAAARAALLKSKAMGALDFVCEATAEAEEAGMQDPKAMMIVRSRQHCSDYRDAFLELLATRNAAGAAVPSSSAAGVARRLAIIVAFSGTLEDGTHRAVSERMLNDGVDVLTAFRAPGPALLIVCSKLETGFDEPRVCSLVIDRTLRGAHAVQVLGRANRVCPHKPLVRVLDLANTANDIAGAFRAFLGITSRSIEQHERRLNLGRELAHISERLLIMIADRSIGAVASDAIVNEHADSLAAALEEYVRGCERLGEEAVQLPVGFATRLLAELKSATSVHAAALSRHGAGTKPPEEDGVTAKGYHLQAGELAVAFSGRIAVDGAAERLRLLTRPLTHATDLKLSGDNGAATTLPEAVAAATALSERAVQALLLAPPHRALTSTEPLSMDELRRFDLRLKKLLEGSMGNSEGEALLADALHRMPPGMQALRATKAGKSLKGLTKGHGHSTIIALANALLQKWKAAVEAEERRSARAVALQLPATIEGSATQGGATQESPATTVTVGTSGGAQSVDEAGTADAAAADPMRQTAALHFAEALQSDGQTSGDADSQARDGALAASIEQALFQNSGRTTGKVYRSRARVLSSSLRSSRGVGLRMRLRASELSADGLCAMDEKTLAEAMLSTEEKRKRQDRKEREDRAIQSMRIENMGEASDEYKCQNCASKRCALFHTNSMGAVHLTAVPDMIVQCLDCGHRFTV